MSSLKGKPWERDAASVPSSIYDPKGMVGPEERRCYYWLGRNWLSGQGCIVDAGAFLGASTNSFAAGAQAGGHVSFRGRPIIHAYDYFKVVDAYVGEAISNDFRPIKEGESYLDIFEAQTKEHKGLIKTYAGDFLEHRWGGDPIEVLFIDIAKTAALNAHAVGEFFPHLISGRSALVHQDYYHCWHPYIHIGMEFFDAEFELADEHVPHQSRLWRLVREIPAEKIQRMRGYEFSKQERLSLLARLVEKSSDFYRPMIEVVRLWQICLDEDWDKASTEMARLRIAYDIDARPELWATQAQQIEALLKTKLK